jgi:hypothetical protein
MPVITETIAVAMATLINVGLRHEMCENNELRTYCISTSRYWLGKAERCTTFDCVRNSLFNLGWFEFAGEGIWL